MARRPFVHLILAVLASHVTTGTTVHHPKFPLGRLAPSPVHHPETSWHARGTRTTSIDRADGSSSTSGVGRLDCPLMATPAGPTAFPSFNLPCKGRGAECIETGMELYRRAAVGRLVSRYVQAACGLWHGLEGCRDAAAAGGNFPSPNPSSSGRPKCKAQVVASGWFYLGATLALLGDATGAVAAYWAAHHIDRSQPVVLSNVGAVYSGQRDWHAAAAAFSTAAISTG